MQWMFLEIETISFVDYIDWFIDWLNVRVLCLSDLSIALSCELLLRLFCYTCMDMLFDNIQQIKEDLMFKWTNILFSCLQLFHDDWIYWLLVWLNTVPYHTLLN